MEFEHLCRICLQKSKQLIELFKHDEGSTDILNKVYLCSQVVLKPDLDLPSNICCQCIKELDDAISFRYKCLTIQERFVEYCKQIQDNDLTVCQEDFNSSETVVFKDGINANFETETVSNEGSIENLQCLVCNKILKSRSELIRHKFQMHEKQNYLHTHAGFVVYRKFYCTICSYFTSHRQTLSNHVRTHNGDRPHICECGKKFTQLSGLIAHDKTHGTVRFHSCSKCGKQFKFAYALKTHQRVHENGKYSCHICHKVLKQNSTLKSHLQRHYKIHNYICEECGRSFITLPDLIGHRQMHNVETYVECHICGYRTNAKRNLIIHLKRHAGKKPHKCKLCDTKFFTSSALKLHQRKHTREKPYPCPACAQRFGYSSSLNKHMQVIHEITYKWNDIRAKEKQYAL